MNLKTNKKEKSKLIIVDDHQMLIDGLKSLLHGEKDFEVIGEATNAEAALDLVKALAPDILITDINMPGTNGIALSKKIKATQPETLILALSMYGEKEIIHEMLEAGVNGYILKNTGKQELLFALRKLVEGGMYFSEEVTLEIIKGVGQRQRKEEIAVTLTEREQDIVALIAKELTNAAIAKELFISERTVETHRKNIFRKTATKSVIGLLNWAKANGFLK
jgi:two-component system, NarL family, nitrate/nitrite response regulator NarL